MLILIERILFLLAIFGAFWLGYKVSEGANRDRVDLRYYHPEQPPAEPEPEFEVLEGDEGEYQNG